jgi:hypothetical protein
MATSSTFSWTAVRTHARGQSTSDFLIRALLCALAVLICYQFRWEWLRYLTSEMNLRLDAVAGVHLQRLSADTVLWRGQVYQYVVACTFADVWCGAIPFLWDLRQTMSRNLLRLAAFTPALFAFNVLRLTLSDVLCAHGFSWNIGHNVVSGVSYFLIWSWLRRSSRTLQPQQVAASATS